MERGTFGLVIRISRLAGVAPYMRRAKNGLSKPIFALGLITMTSLSLYIAHYLIIQIIKIIDDGRKNTMMLDMIRVFSNYLSVMVLMIGVCTSSKRITHMVRNLTRLDKIHESIRSNKLSITGDTTTHYLLWIYMLGILVMRITDCYLKKSISTYPIFEIFMTTVHFSVELCLLQIVLFSKRVLATLKMINETLHQFSTERNEEGQSKIMNNKIFKPRPAFVYSRNDTLYFDHLRSNRKNKEDITNIDVNESVEYIIRQLSKSYSIICYIIKDTTDVNGILLIVVLLNHMVRMELITYHICLWISYENNLSLEIIFLIYHDLSHIWGLLLMVNTFHQTHAEMERTELLVKCLKCQNGVPYAMNNELDLFQHVLVLQKTTYSPFNMCTLDRPLLVKVFGMLISYLVIILTYGPSLDTSAKKDMLDLIRVTQKF